MPGCFKVLTISVVHKENNYWRSCLCFVGICRNDLSTRTWGIPGFCMAAAVRWSLLGTPRTLFGLKTLVGSGRTCGMMNRLVVSSRGPMEGSLATWAKLAEGHGGAPLPVTPPGAASSLTEVPCCRSRRRPGSAQRLRNPKKKKTDGSARHQRRH